MKLKEAINDTNEAVKKASKGFSSELTESIRFYKQAWSDIVYANKCMLVFTSCCLLMILFPILYVYAVIIRMVKK